MWLAGCVAAGHLPCQRLKGLCRHVGHECLLHPGTTMHDASAAVNAAIRMNLNTLQWL